MNMPAIDIDLDPYVASILHQMARSQGRTLADLIVDALEAYAGQYKPPHPLGLGEFDSEEIDFSERVEEILRDAARSGPWR